MRSRKLFKRISVTEEVYNMLCADKRLFQKTQDSRGKWSISDVIKEYKKGSEIK